jgi:hypothetical protein
VDANWHRPMQPPEITGGVHRHSGCRGLLHKVGGSRAYPRQVGQYRGKFPIHVDLSAWMRRHSNQRPRARICQQRLGETASADGCQTADHERISSAGKI